ILGIVLIPYVGVPLYLLLSGKKIRRLAALKTRIRPRLPGAPLAREATRNMAAVRAMCSNGAPDPVGGNRIQLITSGEDAFARFEEQILAARESIHITTFILGRDRTGRALIKLLARRAREGVRVRLLLEIGRASCRERVEIPGVAGSLIRIGKEGREV